MSYLVLCTFDLKRATLTDYQNAYKDLAAIGLYQVVVGDRGEKVVAPTTTVMGQIVAETAPRACEIARDKVVAAFRRRGFASEVFILSAGVWSWIAETT